MKKRRNLLPLILALALCLTQSPAGAASTPAVKAPTQLHTVVPEGVREINLRAVLGSDAPDVEEAWMLNADVCVILRRPTAEDEDIDMGYEIIVWDTKNDAILSRTTIPDAMYPSQKWEGTTFCILFYPQDIRPYDPAFARIKATVAQDGTVDITDDHAFMVMPGGKTAIRTANDGSLYAVDLATGKEELLIQGVPGMGIFWDWLYSDEEIAELFPFMGEGYDLAAKYVPFRDELPENWEALHDNSIPFTSNGSSDDIFAIRQFYAQVPLDEHRFVYSVSGWEWGCGFGVYDLETRTNHRITGRGRFCGVAGGMILGTNLMADANTYKTSPTPASVRDLLNNIGDGIFSYDISPDGKLLAASCFGSRSDALTVVVVDIRTGDIVKTYDIVNPFASEEAVSFYDDTRLTLFCSPNRTEGGSTYLYLFNVGE